MADEADIAQGFTESFLQECQIRQKHEVQQQMPEPTGNCLFCGEKLKNASKDVEVSEASPLSEKQGRINRAILRRWCDDFCRDDWQREEDAKRRKYGRAPLVLVFNDSEE